MLEESEREPIQSSPSRWAWIRAGLISLFVAFNFIQASPSPGQVSKTAHQDPVARAELDRWVGLFAVFGLEYTPKEIGELTYDFAENWKKTKRWIGTPMRPFWTATATQQGWGLFTYPDTHPYEMEIQILGKSRDFETIFLSHHPEYDFSWSLLTYRRFRALYNPGKRAPITYRGATHFLAARTFEAYPEASKVRIRFRRLATPLPGEAHVRVRAKKGVYVGKNRIRSGTFSEEARLVLEPMDASGLSCQVSLSGVSVEVDDRTATLRRAVSEGLEAQCDHRFSAVVERGRLRIESKDKTVFRVLLWDAQGLADRDATVRFSRTIKPGDLK